MSQNRQRSSIRKGARGVPDTSTGNRSASRKRNPSSTIDELEAKKMNLAESTPEKIVQYVDTLPKSPMALTDPESKTEKSDRNPDDDMSTADQTESTSVSHITLKQEDPNYIAECLKNAFRTEMKEIIKESVGEAVEGVLRSLNDRVNDLETQNLSLTHENVDIKERVLRLEGQCEQHEQYSRRNCLRISGVPEIVENESTDDYIMKVCKDLDVPVTLRDIDRSHRVGRKEVPGNKKPRAIIVKFATYRARNMFYKSRFNLKSRGYANIFVNEDLTKKRNSLLYRARLLVKSSAINKAWSSDGQILIKDRDEKILQIHSDVDLRCFE